MREKSAARRQVSLAKFTPRSLRPRPLPRASHGLFTPRPPSIHTLPESIYSHPQDRTLSRTRPIHCTHTLPSAHAAQGRETTRPTRPTTRLPMTTARPTTRRQTVSGVLCTQRCAGSTRTGCGFKQLLRRSRACSGNATGRPNDARKRGDLPATMSTLPMAAPHCSRTCGGRWKTSCNAHPTCRVFPGRKRRRMAW